ncbi:class I SAM-dependent methyltransferase [Nanoarchaeota archaeon]
MESYNHQNLKANATNTHFEALFAGWVHKRFFKRPGKLCDVGSGNGSNSLAFQKKGYKVTVLDKDSFYFDRLRSKGVECKKINLDQSKFPFKQGEIDFFFAKSIIEHLKEPLDFLKEANRCLKKGGKIFLLTPDWNKNFNDFYNDPTHKSPFTKRSMVMALNMAGFKVIKVRNFKNVPYLWRFFPIKAFDIDWFGSNNFLAVAKKI